MDLRIEAKAESDAGFYYWEGHEWRGMEKMAWWFEGALAELQALLDEAQSARTPDPDSGRSSTTPTVASDVGSPGTCRTRGSNSANERLEKSTSPSSGRPCRSSDSRGTSPVKLTQVSRITRSPLN